MNDGFRLRNSLWQRERPDIWPTPRRAGIARDIKSGQVPEYDQRFFRVKDDTTTLHVDSGWLADEDIDPPAVGTGTSNRIRLRVTVDETNGQADINTFVLRFSHNIGSYAAVGISSGACRVTGGIPTHLADTTTQLLASAPAGAYDAAKYCDTVAQASWDHDKGAFGEFEFCIYFVDAEVDHNDTFDFHITLGVIDLDVYTVTPRITITKPAAPTGPPIGSLSLMGVGR